MVERAIVPYDREKAINYAHKWAFKRNPQYFNFEEFGGDCTNFASQVLYAGSGIMNFTPVYGWYYQGSYRRTASWTGVAFLYQFLTNNKGVGPFAKEVSIEQIEVGDLIQLSFFGDGIYQHTPIVVSTGTKPNISNVLVAAHSLDCDNYPLTEYTWTNIRYIHILGVKK